MAEFPRVVSAHRGSIASVIALLLLAGSWPGTAAEPERPPLQWRILGGCRLLPDETRDGDSFHVMTSDNREFIFRLYFADAPETDASVKDRVKEQAKYFGVSQDEVIKAGQAAKKFAAEWLKRGCKVTTRMQPAGGRSRLPRFFAQIEVAGQDLGELLVKQGWARAKGKRAILPDGKPAKEHMAKLKDLEAEARKKKLGIWADSTKAAR